MDIPSSSIMVTMAEEGSRMTSEGSSLEVSKTGMVSSASQMESSTTVIFMHCRWFVGVSITDEFIPI